MLKSLAALLSLPLAAVLALALPSSLPSHLAIPSAHDSAILARRILHLSKTGTLSTVFPPARDDDAVSPDAAVAGTPIGLLDYFADCDPADSGNPTILAIEIATSFRNVRAGSNISLAVQWVPPYPPDKRISLWSRLSGFLFNTAPSDTPDTAPYSAANLPRFSLIGYIDRVDNDAVPHLEHDALAECFVAKHPDARYWLPGNSIHRSEWVKLVVTHVYWVGGFGDRAYIGWLPLELYNSVSRDQWEAVRLPGEEPGWKEWSIIDGEL